MGSTRKCHFWIDLKKRRRIYHAIFSQCFRAFTTKASIHIFTSRIITFLPSNSCEPAARTLSTLLGSENVTKPNPLQMNTGLTQECNFASRCIRFQKDLIEYVLMINDHFLLLLRLKCNLCRWSSPACCSNRVYKCIGLCGLWRRREKRSVGILSTF